MSEWKQGAAKRRDARRGGPVAERPPTRAKKDRKRWCRGKEGVEHMPVAKTYDEAKGLKIMPSGRPLTHAGWWVLVCTECGKELAHHFPWPRKEQDYNRPAWVPAPPKSADKEKP